MRFRTWSRTLGPRWFGSRWSGRRRFSEWITRWFMCWFTEWFRSSRRFTEWITTRFMKRMSWGMAWRMTRWMSRGMSWGSSWWRTWWTWSVRPWGRNWHIVWNRSEWWWTFTRWRWNWTIDLWSGRSLCSLSVCKPNGTYTIYIVAPTIYNIKYTLCFLSQIRREQARTESQCDQSIYHQIKWQYKCTMTTLTICCFVPVSVFRSWASMRQIIVIEDGNTINICTFTISFPLSIFVAVLFIFMPFLWWLFMSFPVFVFPFGIRRFGIIGILGIIRVLSPIRFARRWSTLHSGYIQIGCWLWIAIQRIHSQWLVHHKHLEHPHHLLHANVQSLHLGVVLMLQFVDLIIFNT